MRVRVDVRNPGQYYACCGLLELAHRTYPRRVEGCFEDAEFQIAAPEDASISRLIGSLAASDLRADHEQAKKPLRRVRIETFTIALDWWIDSRGDKTPLKLWAGQQTSLGIIEQLQRA